MNILGELIFANLANLVKIAKINSRKNVLPQKFVPSKIWTFKVVNKTNVPIFHSRQLTDLSYSNFCQITNFVFLVSRFYSEILIWAFRFMVQLNTVCLISSGSIQNGSIWLGPNPVRSVRQMPSKFILIIFEDIKYTS